MNWLIILFWIFLAILFYCWFGYAVVVWILKAAGLARRNGKGANNSNPEVTLVITAYREDSILEEKLVNSLAIDYPTQIILVLDGETLITGLQERYPAIRIIHQNERSGKYEAIKTAMKEVQTPIVVFSDANNMLNRESIGNLVKHYGDPRTGGVAGEKKVSDLGSSALGAAEGIYWKYESFLKQCDADLYTVTGAAGEIYSIRTELFQPIEEPLIIEDFVISMQVCLQGYRMAYEPQAISSEAGSGDLKEESGRRIRIAAGVFYAMKHVKKALNFFRHPVLAFQFFSRRILRWFICPVLLVLVFVLNILIMENHDHWLYDSLFFIQLGLYLLSAIGWVLLQTGSQAGWLSIPFYFVFMNYCMIRGLLRYLGKKQPAAWEKTER